MPTPVLNLSGAGLLGLVLGLSRGLWSVALLVIVSGCGGVPSAPTAPVEPRPSLPVLTAMTVILSQDSVPASQSIAATVRAVDELARPMTVGVIAWTSDDPSVASITTEGAVLARNAGTTTIRAQVGKVEAERRLTVTPIPPGPLPIVAVSVTPIAREIDVGSSQQLLATPRDFAGRALPDREIAWTSSDEAIAIVAADGVITARSVGTAIIEAISEGQRGTAEITVTAALDTSIVVAISAPEAGAEVGDSVTVIATVRSLQPLDSVVMTIAGRAYPMRLVLVGNNANALQPTWNVTADISTLVFGPIAIVVTATDNLGHRGLLVLALKRTPKVPGGNKAPPGSK